jgi:hypothetical protein
MTRTGTIFAAISSLFVCSAGIAQSPVDIRVFAGADTLHVAEIVAGSGVHAHDMASPEQIDALYQSFPLKRESVTRHGARYALSFTGRHEGPRTPCRPALSKIDEPTPESRACSQPAMKWSAGLEIPGRRWYKVRPRRGDLIPLFPSY